jgi:hypothetical protein
MINYPYSTATGSISKILSKLQSVGKPAKADKKWMESIGITKSSEQRILLILRFLGFADKKGGTTDLWTNFRSTLNGKKVIGSALKKSYYELFEIYPEAQNATKEELNDFFSTRTDAGGLVISHTVNTFRNLANFAELDGSEVIPAQEVETQSDNTPVEPIPTSQKPTPSGSLTKTLSGKNGVTINLNIQLTVPETTDEKVYDKFFEAMKKHLLS